MNLCLNARDAMPLGGRITLSIRERWLDAAESRLHIARRAGPFVCLSIEDTGTGIPASSRPNVRRAVRADPSRTLCGSSIPLRGQRWSAPALGRHARSTASSRASNLIGLRMKPQVPGIPWSSGVALTTTTGIARILSSFDRSSRNCHPSITGMLRSNRIRSGRGPVRSDSSASRPLQALATAYPSSRSTSATVSLIAAASSTTRTVVADRPLERSARPVATWSRRRVVLCIPPPLPGRIVLFPMI
jgi:hypothetical protein